jgi:hypothetical protein
MKKKKQASLKFLTTKSEAERMGYKLKSARVGSKIGRNKGGKKNRRRL